MGFKEVDVYGDNHCSGIFLPCDERSRLALIRSHCVSLPTSQDVGVFFCVCVKYSGKPDALLQGKEEKVCQGESARSETDIQLTVTFSNSTIYLCFLKRLGLIIKSRHTIRARHPLQLNSRNAV